jgi:peptidoglycan-N-acetylglucosamine deacetylase
MKQVIVTTSWDDGDPLDVRLAQALRERGLPGTFYVPIIGYCGRRTMKPSEMQDLSREGFEIGAHSYSHRTLRGMEPFELRSELVHSREILENHLGHSVSMFCYPNGQYDQQTLQFVRDAGYRGARTTRMLRTDAGENAFEMPTTLQAFPHPPITYLKNTLKGRNVSSLLRYSLDIAYATDWVHFGKSTFDHVLANGGVWHLYGHSWELEDLRLWDGLRELLDHVAGHKEIFYVTNGELADIAHPQSQAALAA